MSFSKISNTFLFIFILIFVSFTSSTKARNLLNMHELKNISSLKDRLYLTALPKATIPTSTPSKKGHSETINRILRSVPSPGLGH
ncbi:hypothetical protein A4A49_60877 [Nicotiana attenuata]|uniref:Uncharacterized protein n=1 Tax=Nicotiana attenuata TaxID=49451 RepID=A0A1J6HZN9_NICAT|nr:hypothetical protein A4A49_60877 [Nicotiana attenuata]